MARTWAQRSVCGVLVHKREGRTPKLEWMDNIKMNFKEIGGRVWTGYVWLLMRQMAGCCECRWAFGFRQMHKLFVGFIRRTACARAQFSGCSSTTNVHSETGQMAVCCQNLPLGALSSRNAPSMLVGALFEKFGLFLNTGVCVEHTLPPARLLTRMQEKRTVQQLRVQTVFLIMNPWGWRHVEDVKILLKALISEVSTSLVHVA